MNRDFVDDPAQPTRAAPHVSAAYAIRSPPETDWIDLPLAPRLESWMAKDHPDSVRLRAFVDDTLSRIAQKIDGTRCGLEPSVRFPPGTSLVGGGLDLDNYLFPLVARLGARRASIVSVFATKELGERSRIRVGTVRATAPPVVGCSFAGTEASGAVGSRVWRDQVITNLRPGGEAAPPGAVDLCVAFRGPRKNWHEDWKPTIDGLGAILGRDEQGRHADDSRITRLALHRLEDPALRGRTLIGVWRRPFPPEPGARGAPTT